jgi:monomeric isocitrate dehydrogenase
MSNIISGGSNLQFLSIILTTLFSIFGSVVIFWIKGFFARYSERFEKTERGIEKIDSTMGQLFELIHKLEVDVVQKISDNSKESQALSARIDVLETRLDNIENIIDRRKR